MLCWVLDGATLARVGDAGVAAALRGGVDWLQVRDRALEDEALLELADRACTAARAAEREVRVVVNRRADVALAAGADGVHLGFDAAPAADARALLGPDATIGVSTHAADEVSREPDAGYATLAPIFAPLSKRSERPPLGTDALREACRRGVPVLAQGGIDASNAGAVHRAGAAGVAVIGAISAAEDPERAARALREALDA